MPYNSTNDIPDNVRQVLPEHAQTIYKEAFNSAYEEYKEPEDRKSDSSQEEVAHRVPWSAVKQKYHKDDDGQWRQND